MQRANRHLSVLYRCTQRFLGRRLRSIGLDVGLLPSLMQACRCPGTTQEGITQNTGMDKGTTARSIHQLEEQGLVTRVTDKRDRRVNHIYPTDAALALYPQAESILEELHRVLYGGFTPEEVCQTVALLCRMQKNMDDWSSREACE